MGKEGEDVTGDLPENADEPSMEEEEAPMSYKQKLQRVCALLDIEEIYEKPKSNYTGDLKAKYGEVLCLLEVDWIN